MHLLSLLGSGNLASANGPDGLVGNDDLGPVGRADLGLQGIQLLGDNGDGVAGLTLLQRLAAAPDNANTVVDGVLGLAGNEVVGVSEVRAALAVAQDGPGDAAVQELGDGDFAREGAVGLVQNVLRGDLDFLAQVLTSEEKVQSGRGDNNLCVSNWVMSVRV